MSVRFVVFSALRYFRSKRQARGTTVLSVLGVAVGVMTLTAVLGVMNGFQLGFIESILEVSSYHLQVEADGRKLAPAQLEGLRRLAMVRAVTPFAERQAIIEGRYPSPRGCILRKVPEDVASLDPGFRERLKMVEGKFDLAGPAAVVLGVELARHLGVGTGDTVQVLDLQGEGLQELAPSSRPFIVAGLFQSGYYEFDLGWAFARLGPDDREGLRYGIKIRNRFRDRAALGAVRSVLGEGFRVGSWREFNRAFFGALRMEKLLMMVLIGLIFIVVGFNIFHSLRRTVRERFEEIGVLKALGAAERAVRYIFVAEGLLIGLLGSAIGLALGLLLSANINAVFRAVEAAANFVLRLAAGILGGAGEGFSLFSPAYFYISEIPSRVLLPEAFLVVLFALGSCLLAAFFASSAVQGVKPAEILRYE